MHRACIPINQENAFSERAGGLGTGDETMSEGVKHKKGKHLSYQTDV